MKSIKALTRVVLTTVICVVLVGCADRSTNNTRTEGWNDPNSPESQELTDQDGYDDQSWDNPEDYDNQDWDDADNYEDQEWSDLEGSDHTGMYRHEIDGIEFYTEHDVEQWIDHQDGLGMTFDLEQMVKDIFGDEAISGNNVAKFTIPTDIPVSLTFLNINFKGQSDLQAKDGYYPAIQAPGTVICDRGDGSEEYYKPFYFINGTYYCTDYEMIEIALYACEKWAKGPGSHGEYYSFEDFNSSSRIYIIDGNTPRNP